MPPSILHIALICWIGAWIVYCLVHLFRLISFIRSGKFPTIKRGLQEFAKGETSPWSPFSRRGKKLARLYAYGGISIFMLLAMLSTYYETAHPH